MFDCVMQLSIPKVYAECVKPTQQNQDITVGCLLQDQDIIHEHIEDYDIENAISTNRLLASNGI